MGIKSGKGAFYPHQCRKVMFFFHSIASEITLSMEPSILRRNWDIWLPTLTLCSKGHGTLSYVETVYFSSIVVCILQRSSALIWSQIDMISSWLFMVACSRNYTHVNTDVHLISQTYSSSPQFHSLKWGSSADFW